LLSYINDFLADLSSYVNDYFLDLSRRSVDGLSIFKVDIFSELFGIMNEFLRDLSSLITDFLADLSFYMIYFF